MKNKRRGRYLMHILVLFILGSCNQVESGTVIDKRYEEASRDLILIPTRVGKTAIMQQYWIYDNEDWVIIIEGGKRVYVTRKYYEVLNKGDRWVKTDSCSFRDNNNSKLRYK
jgi:hypothetical protein